MLTSNIEQLIKKSGLRKGFIAEKLKITVRQLRKYETGESLIPMDKAYILVKLLKCKVDDLYEEEE
ncbi:helix-turn-helix transcriptional regulator [Bacillus sp. ISL-53]|nr:helix-turn-helix transcriptional regulator [Bacillus sp. ISL-53]